MTRIISFEYYLGKPTLEEAEEFLGLESGNLDPFFGVVQTGNFSFNVRTRNFSNEKENKKV